MTGYYTKMPNLHVSNEAQSFALVSLSSAETSLCCGETGEREKESARGTMEGEREKRGSRLFPLPIVPRALSFLLFSIIAIFIGIPGGSLCGGESVGFIMEKKILPL